MLVRITADANKESGVADVIFDISGPTRKYFATRDYGPGLHGLGVILMCRDSVLNFKRRLRLSRKDRTLYMDVMLDLERMRRSEHQSRKLVILELLAEEIPAILRKYSIADFDEVRFVEDLKRCLTEARATPRIPPNT